MQSVAQTLLAARARPLQWSRRLSCSLRSVLTFKAGQTHVQRFMPELLERTSKGELAPDVIIPHTLPLAEAARGYEMFDKKQDECRKVVLSA